MVEGAERDREDPLPPEPASPPRPAPRRSLRRGVALAGIVLALAAVAHVGLSFLGVYRGTRVDEARPADAIVVLGAAQYWGRPSPVLERRLLRALELYREGHSRVIVTTGSKQAGDRVTEGYAGFEYLLRRGVPERDLLVVVHGTNTWEQMTATAHVLARRGGSTVLLVSDPYHSHRAKRCAEQAGLRAFVSPTATRSTPRQLARETAAVALGTVIGFRRVSTLR